MDAILCSRYALRRNCYGGGWIITILMEKGQDWKQPIFVASAGSAEPLSTSGSRNMVARRRWGLEDENAKRKKLSAEAKFDKAVLKGINSENGDVRCKVYGRGICPEYLRPERAWGMSHRRGSAAGHSLLVPTIGPCSQPSADAGVRCPMQPLRPSAARRIDCQGRDLAEP